MSKRCPDCGFVNDDSRIYCASCGELLDSDLRLIKQLERQTAEPRKSVREDVLLKEEDVPKKDNYDENYVPSKVSKEKKFNPVPWIVLGVAAVAVVVLLIVL